MTWFAWRQFRTQTWVTVGGLAALGVLLLFTGHAIADAYAANVGACHGDCTDAINNFMRQVRESTGDKVYNLATAIMYLAPALIGSFWGAPLISRELETGTHRLAWSQSVTRARWLATKLAVVGAATAATTGLLSWAVTSWAHHIDRIKGDRITPLVYGTRGVVPIGYALFAFALGVTAGMLIRRTVPAMAATLAIYAAAVASMPLWIRAHLLPVSHATPPLDLSSIKGLALLADGQMKVVGGDTIPGAWVLSNQTITPTGQAFTGPANPQYCGPDSGARSCMDWVGTLGLRQDITYQPGSHFWPLQWTEAGMFVAVAILLAGFCFWWTRRRLT